MENVIAFKVGDIVCNKEIVNHPLGTDTYSPFDTIPMVIISVVPDIEFENRFGECGNSNKYLCQPLVVPILYKRNVATPLIKFQYSLVLWKERKEQIVLELKKYVEILEKIS